MTKIDLTFDPKAIRQELDSEPWRDRNEWDFDDGLVRVLYIGRMPWPSGKYYMPWACGNVDPCEKCSGTGLSPQPKQLWPECRMCKGIGYRSITELARLRKEEALTTLYFLRNKFHCVNMDEISWKNDTFTCNLCKGVGQIQPTCTHCDGHGSREVYLDILWWEEAESLYDRFGYSIQCGEDDPTDVFAVEYKDYEEETND